MKAETSSPLPPYFAIDPDVALAALGPATTTQDFGQIARACAAGRHDLASRGLNEAGQRQLRLFSTWEITRYLIPVAQAHFRRVLKQNPELPQGLSETEGGAKWFTLDEVLRLRAFFAAEGSKAKPYAPWRPQGLPAKMLAVANFKVGVGADVMNLYAAAGKCAINQRLCGGSRALQGAGANVNLSACRAARRQQAELAIVCAFFAPFIHHRGIAMAGQFAVVSGPLGPRALGCGFDGFPVAWRWRANTMAAEFNHFFQLILRSSVARGRQQRQGTGKQQA